MGLRKQELGSVILSKNTPSYRPISLFFSVSCFNEHSFFKYSFVVIANASIFVESFELGFSTSAFIQAILCFFYPFSPVSE